MMKRVGTTDIGGIQRFGRQHLGGIGINAGFARLDGSGLIGELLGQLRDRIAACDKVKQIRFRLLDAKVGAEVTARQDGPEGTVVGTAFQQSEWDLRRRLEPQAALRLDVADRARAKGRPAFGASGRVDDLQMWHRLWGMDETGHPVLIKIRFRLDASMS